ncbi:MAG: Fur family transcriptional regulator [Hyphomicrobiaceae bacterium]
MRDHPAKARALNAKETLILEALRAQPRPHSAYELIDVLRSHGVSAPATVYRALQRLIELGLAHRLETLNAFVACVDVEHCAGARSVVFAICDDCGRVEEISEIDLTSSVRKWAKASRFTVKAMTFELRGQCNACSSGA